MSAHETFHLCGSHGCKRSSVPPSQFFRAANYFQQPKPGSPSRGRTRLGQYTLEWGEKEQKEDLHPGQLSALAWPPRRKQSLEGYKGKGPHEYWAITHTMGSGDGVTLSGVTVSSPVPLPPGGATSTGHPARLRGWKDGGGRQLGPRALGTERVPHRPGTGANCQRFSTGGVPSSAPCFTSWFGPWLLIASDRNRRKQWFPNLPDLKLFSWVRSASADQPRSRARCKRLCRFSLAAMGSPGLTPAMPMQQPWLPKSLLPLATSRVMSSASPFPIPSSCTLLHHPFLCLYMRPGLL